MEAPIIVEVLDRFGKVKERHKIKQFPIKIGRSYKNDIIIDDNYISAEHIELMVDGDGHIMATDLHSDNGLFTIHPVIRHDILTVQDNQRIRIGHTDIRFRSENFSVKETFFDHGRPSQWHLIMTNGLILPLIWLLTAGILMANQYFMTTQEVHSSVLLASVLPVLIVIVVWSFIWSVVSKIITHKFYFAYHGIHVGLLLSGFYFIELSFEYLEFIFPVNGLQAVLTVFSDLAFTALLFYGHLRQSTHFRKRKTKITSSVVASLIVGVAYLVSFVNQPQYSGRPDYSGIIKPPAFVMKKPSSSENFFASTKELANFDLDKESKDAKND